MDFNIGLHDQLIANANAKAKEAEEWYKNNVLSNSYQRHYEAMQKAVEKYGMDKVFGGKKKDPVKDTSSGYSYDSYYNSARKALEEAYANARASASNVKTDTIASAYDKYLRATQSYGVEAENLSNAGLSASGGYGQLMNSNRFNAYSNLESNANSGYQKAINDINLAENADKVDLEFQKYQMAMAKEQEKYNNTQTNLSTASALASSWAKVEENKIVNEADVRAKLKKNFDFNDDYIDAIIASLMKG